MKPYVRKLIILGSIGIMLFVIGGIIVSSLIEYHDNNSWAIFEITGDGIPEGEYKYRCTPDVNVKEGSDSKAYGKGETIDLGYASFTVKKVDIGAIEGVCILSDDEMIYKEHILHTVYLVEGDACEIRAQGQSATIKLRNVVYY